MPSFNVAPEYKRSVYIENIKEIKGFERYLIDINGIIYDTKYNNRIVCQWIDTVGYYQCNLKR